MQSAGNFVGRGVEFAASMQFGHDDLRSRDLFAVNVHRIHGDTAPVVDDSNRVVDVNSNFDLVRVTRERFVDGIVDYLVHQMVQPEFAGRANVHCRTLADGFHAAQHFD